MSSLDYLDLCRLCLVKDRVSVPIFEGEGDVRQIFLKIAACLPVKVTREDKLPKKICDDCVYKVELLYQFWNTTANAEKQLLQWLGEVGLEDKQSYVTGVLNPNVMKQEQNGENRLDGNAMQQVSAHQPNMGMGMMDNMGMGMPLMMSTASQQQMTSVPMDTSGNPVQSVQAVPGPSTQTTHDQMAQNQANAPPHQDEEEESSEEEENSDDDCDGDEGLPVKEESEEDPSNSRTLEPTTFVNVSLACDEPGPSGLQQQKIAEMPEMSMPQVADGDPKSGETDSLLLPGVQNETILLSTKQSGPSSNNELRSIGKLTLKNSTDMVAWQFSSDTIILGPKHGYHTALRCNICNKFFLNERYLTDHKKLHEETELYQCKECSKIFRTMQDCQRHVDQMHQNFHCEHCPKLFKTEADRASHIYLKHECRLLYKCQDCNYTCPSVVAYKAHRKVHNQDKEEFDCEVCDFKTRNFKSLRTHQRLHTNDYNIRCDVCSKGFVSQTVLDRHKITHTGERPFTCDVCLASYADRRSLQLHATSHDPRGREKKYRCEVCEYSSFWKGAVRVHMKVHTGAKVICHVCGQAVSSNHYLGIHMRIHTGERPYRCNVCGKGFRQLKNLMVHCRIHTGEKPYECERCQRAFSQKASLRNHKCKKLIS